MEKTVTIIKVRKGLHGFPYSACTEAGDFIGNAGSYDEIHEHWKNQIKDGRVKLVREMYLFPNGMEQTYAKYGYIATGIRGTDSLDEQEAALRKAGATKVFRDTAPDRPAFNQLLQVLRGGDTLIVPKLTCLGLSLTQVNGLIKELRASFVKIRILGMGTIDETRSGRKLQEMFELLSEFEHETLVERTQAGRIAARERGIRVDGRPKKFTPEQLQEAMDLLKEHSYTEVEAMTGISRSTLTRARRQQKAGIDI